MSDCTHAEPLPASVLSHSINPDGTLTYHASQGVAASYRGGVPNPAPTPAPTRPPGNSEFRLRLLEALGESIVERGYRATTVADIVRHAKTSRRTFYQEFASKESCFVELLHVTNDQSIEAIVAAVDPDADWADQIRQAIGAYVRSMDSHPAMTLCWIRELPALGEGARPVQQQAINDFVHTLVTLTDTPQMRAAGIDPVTTEMAIMLLGGLHELTANAVENGRPVADIEDTALRACFALLGPS
ncbi:TetR family transcriptional regulator [Nocardia sp. 348MFTsu5.1]|uniref:TetR/AcrR family transcriptional regulator n=1 Tax=Nocardia sp. 348MFTsu5.1 TaxID=1172185 RepID=UPI0003762194